MNAYLAERNPPAAKRIEDQIRARAEALTLFPFSCPQTHIKGVRQAVVSRTPYLILYTIGVEELRVIAIFHKRQSRA